MAMLKNKHITFSLILVCLMIVSPMAKAQLGGLGNLGGLINGLLGIINVNGVLRCSVNGNASAPVFPNAGVQLQCGGNVVSTSTTNAAGIFSILVNPVQLLLNTLLSDCQLAVTTPLSTCNATLPSVGRLLSSLSFVGNTVSGLLSVANVVPVGFGLVN